MASAAYVPNHEWRLPSKQPAVRLLWQEPTLNGSALIHENPLRVFLNGWMK
jgi:hypothetical protein